jgi:hypothetical protein
MALRIDAGISAPTGRVLARNERRSFVNADVGEAPYKERWISA